MHSRQPNWVRIGREMFVGWTQTEAARNAGVSRTLLNRIEQGLVRPGPAIRERIAAAYGVDADRLFADKPTPTEFCGTFLRPANRFDTHPDDDPDEPDVRGVEHDNVIVDFEHGAVIYEHHGRAVAVQTERGLIHLASRTLPAARRTPAGGRPRTRRTTKRTSGTGSGSDDDGPAPSRTAVRR